MTGKRLKGLRKQAGMTEEEVAEKIGITKTDIIFWENSRRELGNSFPEINEKLNELLEEK